MKVNPLDLNDIKEAFKVLKKPRNFKKLGQNFLIDEEVRDQIIEAAGIKANDEVFEIGPGAGVLTTELVKKAKRVVAIDIDPYMLEVARLATGDPDNLELKLEDIRKINLPKIFCKQTEGPDATGGSYIAVSNLPYLLTGYIFELLLTSKCSPKRIVVMVQKEVAERILAKPGGYSMLTLSVNVFGKPTKVVDVPRDLFWPAPNVDSMVIKIERFKAPLVAAEEQKHFFRIAKAGFSARRKKLANSLSGGLHKDIDEVKEAMIKAEIPENARAQELTVRDWAKLSHILEK